MSMHVDTISHYSARDTSLPKPLMTPHWSVSRPIHTLVRHEGSFGCKHIICLYQSMMREAGAREDNGVAARATIQEVRPITRRIPVSFVSAGGDVS